MISALARGSQRRPGWRSPRLIRARRLIRAKDRACARLDAARKRIIDDLTAQGDHKAAKAVDKLLDRCCREVDVYLFRAFAALIDPWLRDEPPAARRPTTSIGA